MLLLALACRHASPPEPSVDATAETVSVATCDFGWVAHALQKQLGPQRCNTDSDCTSHGLSELASMMPADARQRLGRVGTESDPMAYTPSLLLGPDTTMASLVDPGVELVRTCAPPSWRPGLATGKNGAVVFRSVRPAESAQFVGADGVTREQCVAEFAAPACIDSVCTWRPETRVVPCSQVSADSSM
jgi:hypothetical protein